MFNQEEYANIIKLLHKSDPTSTSIKMNEHLDKLSEIMKKVGVAVWNKLLVFFFTFLRQKNVWNVVISCTVLITQKQHQFNI